jgi:hypothetical protein
MVSRAQRMGARRDRLFLRATGSVGEVGQALLEEAALGVRLHDVDRALVGGARLVDFSRPKWSEFGPQLTAFFTSSPIFFSSAAVNCFSAKEVGHMEPLSRLAESVKPKVAYLASNFCPL